MRLSADTQAILLLTAPLIVGRREASVDPLKPAEYKKLARRLRERQCSPADLLTDLLTEAGSEAAEACRPVVEEARLRSLLGRGLRLSQAVERWQARAIWVLSRADEGYPRRLKARLRDDAPAVLYGCGPAGLLDGGGLAVVGSRHVDRWLEEHTEGVGRLVAGAGFALVSGGARGIDQAAMRGALSAGGRALGVLADSLERAAVQRQNRDLLMEGRLTLVTAYDPSAGFNVGHAMQRNKLIYALADAALVVSADAGKGGTWAGAVEQLEKLRLVQVYVRTGGPPQEGLDALRRKGALPWPEPESPEELRRLLTSPSLAPTAAHQISLPIAMVRQEEPEYGNDGDA
jgi:DNA processing protein